MDAVHASNDSHEDTEQDIFHNVKYPLKYHKKYFVDMEYGTAGFRGSSFLLEHIMYRMGLLAVLRSKKQNAAVGLMITASHNLEPDNGIKLVDSTGEMLQASWETDATTLANVNDQDLKPTLRKICKDKEIDLSRSATVIVGRDTRTSSSDLLNAVIAGIKALESSLIDLGEVTTPQLHYIVVCKNTYGAYGDPILPAYYSKLATAFKNTRGAERNNNKYKNVIYLDAANGVGVIAATQFQKYLENSLDINIFNVESSVKEKLNNKCGADYVKVQQAPPLNTPSEPNVRCVSIDGDADRVVYFYVDETDEFHLMDGDRIATLIAAYFKELLGTSGLSLELGLVQTAYANGASTEYICDELGIPVECVPTGVKHLHKRAKEFDIGIYFEANGHGTVVFKDSAKELIKRHAGNVLLSKTQKAASKKLRAMIDIINETVGDAFSDMLLVETILHAKGWDIIEWEKTYKELPCKQLKVEVTDRKVITTTDAERRCVTPHNLQNEIDEIVAKYQKSRCFIRPSGTENIVRVYAECENALDVDKLAEEVAGLVDKYVNCKK